ncbi:MAG TPA: hypothetical protein VFB14_18370 [Bryobacteraceae bacterium]|jgi:hypothetical protein|nr:hypothetical protein [Bryobacteraceae bacterium]
MAEKLSLSKMIEIAEKQTAEAKRAKDAGEWDGEERFQQWSETLEALRIMHKRGIPETIQG